MFRTLTIFVLVFIAASAIYAQVKIDTIGDNYEKILIDGIIYYKCYNDKGDTTLVQDKPYRSLADGHPNAGHTGGNYISNDNQNIFLKGYIVSPDYVKACDIKFDAVYEKFDENYLVVKNDSCFILNKNCNLKYVCAKDNILRISSTYGNPTIFLVRNSIKGHYDIYNYNLEKKGQIKNVKESHWLRQNKYTFWTYSNLNGDDEYASNIYDIYSHKGKLLTQGYILDTNDETLLIENLDEKKEIYFKTKKVKNPKEFSEISPMIGLNYLKVKVENGNIGIYSNSLKKEIIPPQYKWISHFHEPNPTKFSSMFSRKKLSFYFAAVDDFNRVHIFTYEGKEIDLQIKIELEDTYRFHLSPNFAGSFYLNDKLSFFTINRSKKSYDIFDKDWNYISTSSKDEESNYSLMGNSSSAIHYLAPIKTLTHFKNFIEKDVFFTVTGDNPATNNIIDSNLNLIFKNNVNSLRQIDENHFIISEATPWDRPYPEAKIQIIKLSLE